MPIGGIGSAGITTIRDIGEIVLTVDGGGSSLSTGDVKAYYTLPYPGIITAWFITGDPSGSVSVDVWRKPGAIPSVADTITTDYPTLSGQSYNKTDPVNPALWSVSCNAGDVFGFSIRSASGVTKVVLTLQLARN